METIKVILKMASTDLIKAIVETGYMEDPYGVNDYMSFDSSIDRIS